MGDSGVLAHEAEQLELNQIARPAERVSARQRYARLRYWVATTDVAAIVLGLGIVHGIRLGWTSLPAGVRPIHAAAPLAVVAVFAALRLYSLSQLSPADEFSRITWAVTAIFGALLLVGVWPEPHVSRGWSAVAWIISLVCALSFRRAWHRYMSRAKIRGDLAFRTLIVGTNEEAARLAHALSPADLGFRVLGAIETRDGDGAFTEARVLGNIESLPDVIRQTRADCIFVAGSAASAADVAKVTKAGRILGAEVRVSANLHDMLTTRLHVQQIGGMMTLSLKPIHLTGTQELAKRGLDLVLAIFALALTVPLWPLIALAIKVDSRGPVLYRQTRVGRHGKLFTLLKFRTMVLGADDQKAGLLDLNEASGPMFKLRKDPRVTRVGATLRRWSLDELPQLLNVLRGQMSLVGPRPALPDEVEQYEGMAGDRLEVPPGITGLWQIKGRSTLPFEDYVRLDLFYIENWSIGLDLYIMAKTVPSLFARDGAY